MKKLLFKSLIIMGAMLAAVTGLISCDGDTDDNNAETNSSDNKHELPTIGGTVADAVDLGLSVKWASHNVGAKTETGSGGLYVWGDPTGNIKPEDVVEELNYAYKFPDDICGTQYDIARVQWGEHWRLPTLYELSELESCCKWDEINNNGVRGVEITGLNGNTIFIPYAGYKYGNEVHDEIVRAYIWSGTQSAHHDPMCLELPRAAINIYSEYGYYGQSIRPVYDESEN